MEQQVEASRVVGGPVCRSAVVSISQRRRLGCERALSSCLCDHLRLPSSASSLRQQPSQLLSLLSSARNSLRLSRLCLRCGHVCSLEAMDVATQRGDECSEYLLQMLEHSHEGNDDTRQASQHVKQWWQQGDQGEERLERTAQNALKRRQQSRAEWMQKTWNNNTSNASNNDRVLQDAMAWLHEAVCVEKDWVEQMFGQAIVTRNVVGVAMDGCVRAMQQRMEQAIDRQDMDLVGAHEARTLLQFYRVTLDPYMTNDCRIMQMLASVQNRAKARYDALLQLTAKESLNNQTVHPDLGPPSLLHRMMPTLSRVAESIRTSLLPPEERTPEAILYPLLDPLLEMVQRTSAGLSEEFGAVFTINCLLLIREALAPHHQVVGEVIQKLDRDIAQAEQVVSRCEIRILLARAGIPDVVADPSSLMLLEPKAISDAVRTFETTVLGSGDFALVLSACDKVQDAAIRDRLKKSVAAAMSDTYAAIHKMVHDPTNNVPDALQIAQYTPEQFKILLG